MVYTRKSYKVCIIIVAKLTDTEYNVCKKVIINIF